VHAGLRGVEVRSAFPPHFLLVLPFSFQVMALCARRRGGEERALSTPPVSPHSLHRSRGSISHWFAETTLSIRYFEGEKKEKKGTEAALRRFRCSL